VKDGDVLRAQRFFFLEVDKRWLWPGLVLGLILIGAAVATELRKPAEERTWEGRIAGRVPYDLRPPTLARGRERLWNPADRRVFVPTVFGVGWTVNFGGLLRPWVAAPP